MENLLYYLATRLAQQVAAPHVRRYRIGSHCSALLHSNARTLQVRFTREGDRIYFNNYSTGHVTYGIVCVQMRQRYALELSEHILLNFMKRVRRPLHIVCHLAPEICRQSRFVTVTGYWQDRAGCDWKVKGYTNEQVLSLLYVKNIGDAAVKNHETFLNGFRFWG